MTSLKKVLLGAVLIACTCAKGERTPVSAVRALIAASATQDRKEVYQLLGAHTRAALDERAKTAREMAGHRDVRPEEMLAVGWTSPAYQPSAVEEINVSGDHATVEVVGPHGQRDRVECVREGGAWRIELP